MNTTMQTWAPADLLGLGGSVASPCTDVDLRTVIGVSPATRVAPFQGSGVPAGSPVARLRTEYQPVVAASQLAPIAHNSIDGTTLGFHPSGRPLS